MEPDRTALKGQAIESLRAALVSGSGVADALRWCWYQHPLFAAALLTEASRRRFGSRPDIRAITAFMAKIRVSKSMLGLPSREAEALIRAVLGEMFLLESVPADRFSLPEIGISVLTGMYEEGNLGRTEWEGALQDAQRSLLEGYELSPKLIMAENEWLATGLHNSPLAIFDEEASARE